ncbi:hypothetical protein GCM10027516_23070 [Niabella aquatica]
MNNTAQVIYRHIILGKYFLMPGRAFIKFYKKLPSKIFLQYNKAGNFVNCFSNSTNNGLLYTI